MESRESGLTRLKGFYFYPYDSPNFGPLCIFVQSRTLVTEGDLNNHYILHIQSYPE